MKLALLGYPITHSLSPKLYLEILGPELESYELISAPEPKSIPTLEVLAKRLNGLNITSPYKTHFINDIIIESELVREIGAVNTLAFSNDKVYGTNTDVLAVEEILQNYLSIYGRVCVALLGSGVMAKVTQLVCVKLGIPFENFSRKLGNLDQINLRTFGEKGMQTIVVNSCSRDYVFNGLLNGTEIFWDYNYNFFPHSSSIPSQVISYQDGQEMLLKQAVAAVKFWRQTNSKLKY